MKLELDLAPNCPHCKRTLELIRAEETKVDPNMYGTFNLTTEEYHKGFVLRPDRNAAGVLTYWHLDDK